jgi:hypothetical protein
MLGDEIGKLRACPIFIDKQIMRLGQPFYSAGKLLQKPLDGGTDPRGLLCHCHDDGK